MRLGNYEVLLPTDARNAKVGKYYIKRWGKSPILVERVESYDVYGKYVGSNHNVTMDRWAQLCEVKDQAQFQYMENGVREMTATLYQVVGKEEYGTQLAVNSEGKIVLEMKKSGQYANGDLATFDKSELKEVLPYTVAVRFKDGSQDYHYLATEGSVEKGDILLIDGSNSFATVKAINTESKLANKQLKGRKLQTTEI